MATEVVNNVPALAEEKLKEEPAAEVPATEEPAAAAEDAAAAKAVEPSPPKATVHKANFEKDIVYLYQFSRTPLLPSLSPYCLKVETWLRLAGLKYEVSAIDYSLHHPDRFSRDSLCLFLISSGRT